MKNGNRNIIRRIFLELDYTRIIIMDVVIVVYCFFLCFDCYRKGVPSIGNLALFDAVAVLLTLPVFFVQKFRKFPQNRLLKVLTHAAIIFHCLVFWNSFAVYFVTGSMGGTSIFLIFIAAPIGFYFYNLFYGFLFCSMLFTGMAVYMWTPLHDLGYAFPEIYNRLPIMYLVEVIICALAQYEIVRAQAKTEMALADAEEANRAKSDFLSNMSHEIRTPINAILGMNEMIKRESTRGRDEIFDKEEESRETFGNVCKYSHNIENAGNNLLSIINDILDFSKIEAGKIEIVEAEYKLSSVLNDVSNMILFKTEEKKLDFTTEVDENIPDLLCGDELRVRQVLINILNNAVKYTNKGSICLSVKSLAKSEDSITLIFAVRDTGIGIKKEDIGKLWGKFQRVDLKQNSTVEGTGLGLAITHTFLEMMGGSIGVESEYGKGSVFTIILPQKIVSEEPIGNFRERLEKSIRQMHIYEESFRAPNARILIVDDTRMNLMVSVGLLKDTEMQIDTALSGAEAVKMAREISYDVILMDQRMPEMDGSVAMQKIKEDEDSLNRNTPFICLTADAVNGARERYLSEGFDDYLTKPIDYKAMERMLVNYLPAEKVEAAKAKEKKSGTKALEGSHREPPILKEAGIDYNTGLLYCQEDEDFYKTLLREYAGSAAEKKDKLKSYIDLKDWRNYGVTVHAVKSTSKTLGANGLSEEALILERAAKDGDYEKIINGHDGLMAHYDKTVNAIIEFLKDEGIWENDPGDLSGDAEIFDFSPKS